MNGKACFAWPAPACVLMCAIPLLAPAQDLDTAILSTPAKTSTILDQIERPKERSDFAALYKESDPQRRLQRTQAFLAEYPDSWMLPVIYEMAAKASIDLNDLASAISYAKESLRLFPENPLLLVPLANVQVQQGLLGDGETSAHAALEYLDRFARPSSVLESQWPGLRAQLQASSFYALGKIRVLQGKLPAAVADLTAAAQLNPEDAEIQYLLGLARRAEGDRKAATSATTVPHELSPAGEYAGSEACRNCHADQHAAWQQTGMARMLRPYRSENVFGDFTKQKQFEDSAGRIIARMGIEKDRHYFSTRGERGQWVRYPVDYTIGSKWQQAYATRLPDGQIHVFPIQYNKLEGAWVNYWKIIDPPGSERPDPDLFHTMSARTNYQTNCAPCHTSQLRAGNPGAADTRALVFREAGVNCEMCHGPSARHAAAMRAGKAYTKLPAEPPVDFARLDNRLFVAICAQCHMQSAIREAGPKGEWNYSETGGSFLARYTSRPLVDFSRRAFYKDGRFRETTFIVEAFMRSACYRKGPAQCANCHDVHPADAATNPTSLKYRDEPDRMCLQCHASYATRIEAHTHHPASSEASRCVSCHMPRIMNSLLFVTRTHQIDDVPNAAMTLRFGQRESPNACLLCHGEKDAKWAAARLQSW